MSNESRSPSSESISLYDLFIGVLTVFSLVVMGWMILPWISDSTESALRWVDSVICIVFLFDFARHMVREPSKRDYFFKQHGWLDLVGSIPTIGGRETSLLRLARLARLGRIARLARARSASGIVQDVRAKRAEGALVAVLLLAIIFVTITSVMVLQAESDAENKNIVSGGDSFWWAFVTVTTVGYGDRFPTTAYGRMLGMVLMTIGVGLFGVLTSYVSSLVLPRPPTVVPEASADVALVEDPTVRSLQRELQEIREEMTRLRVLLEGRPPAT